MDPVLARDGGDDRAAAREVMARDCPERDKLKSEWHGAVEQASELQKRQHDNPGTITQEQVRQAWEGAEHAFEALERHQTEHGCRTRR